MSNNLYSSFRQAAQKMVSKKQGAHGVKALNHDSKNEFFEIKIPGNERLISLQSAQMKLTKEQQELLQTKNDQIKILVFNKIDQHNRGDFIPHYQKKSKDVSDNFSLSNINLEKLEQHEWQNLNQLTEHSEMLPIIGEMTDLD